MTWPRSVRGRAGALRASVGSTEAAKDVVARVGRIDRRIREATSWLDMFCTPVILDL
jgi:hypothetical protein